MLFGIAAAVAVGLLEGAVTRGFRERVRPAPPEVRMFGTALSFISVTAGIGAAAAVAALLDTGAAWPLAACAATIVFLGAESAETLVAELVQKRRGDQQAEGEDG